PLRRYAHADGDPGKLIRLRLAPDPPRNHPEAARENQHRRPAVEEQLGSSDRDDLVMAAQDENRIRAEQLMIQAMVAPDLLDQRTEPRIDHACVTPTPASVRRGTGRPGRRGPSGRP